MTYWNDLRLGVLGVAVLLAAGCNLKFPGPHFGIDVPDAAVLGNFAGNGALGGDPQQPVPASRAALVIDAPVSVQGSAPIACPPGQMEAGGSCRLRTGVAKQCPGGASACAGGQCCAPGYACGASGACERAPGGSSVSQPGFCASGQLVTSDGSSCPAINAGNASELAARCCPSGASLQCSDPSDASTAGCTLQSLVTSPCPTGYQALTDGVTNAMACCPAGGGSVQLANGVCWYFDQVSPQCAGTVDATTGACCAGQLTSDGGCCAPGHAACGSGCCESGELCDAASGQCQAQVPAQVASCPAQAPVDCSSSGGQCCPVDSSCMPDGTCSCPASTPVDCGGFCAASAQQCSCPPDHPEACGASCCLGGGCFGGAGSGSCGCPSGTTSCGDNCCPASAQCQDGQCLACPSDAPTLCGTNCCAQNEMCVGGQCVGCTSDAPIACGSSCCRLGDSCSGGVCVPPPGASAGSAGASGPDLGGAGAGAGGDDRSGGSGGVAGSGGGGVPGSEGGSSCMPVPAACSDCSVTACASVTGSGSCQSWYDTSDGQRFSCAGCGDCTSAAENAVLHCCPVHL